MKKEGKKTSLVLSASKIKTYLTCSWCYYVTYSLGFRGMDEGNDGSKRGTISHLILQLLQNPKREKIRKLFLKKGLEGNDAIKRLILKHAKKLEIDDSENLSLIESFIQVGLKSDFLCEGWNLKEPEKKFEIESIDPEYKILGYIDKHAISPCSSICRIDDYKTSKQKFTGKDAKFNIQALMYALALYKEGLYNKYFVNFIFLKFPKSPLQSFEFNQKILKGFEIYLSDIYKYLKNFNVKKACENFAKDNENYFLCGKELGDINAKGNPAWVCPWKRPFLYWEIRDKDKNIKFTSKEKEKVLDKMAEGDIITQKYYAGCPKFNRL